MSGSQSRALAGGIALHLGAQAALVIALVRLYTALLGQHFGLFWLALLPLGIGIGARLASLVGGIGRPPRSLVPAARLAAFTAGGMAISVVFGVRARTVDAFDRPALLDLALFAGTSLLPFALSGATLVGVLGAARRRAGEIGKSGLFGAALGVVVAAFVLPFGPARVGLGAAIVAAIGALLISLAARKEPDEIGAHAVTSGIVATFVLGTSVLLAGEIGAPYLKLAALKWIQLERVEWQRFTNHGLLTVDKPRAGATAFRVDGALGIWIYEDKQSLPVSPYELAYVLSEGKGPILVLGGAGGRDLKITLRHHAEEIHAIEADPTVVDEVVRGHLRAFTGDIYAKPEIHVGVEGLRAHARGHRGAYRSVIVPYQDTLQTGPLGVFAATPSSLFTTRAVRDLFGALSPEGTLTLSQADTDADRLVALAVAALREEGVSEPVRHLFGCTKDRVTSLLVKRSPLGGDQVTALRSFCRSHKFPELLMGEAPKGEVRRMLVEGADPAELSAQKGVDLRPPTDDRPFFYATVAPGELGKVLRDLPVLKDRHRALLVLGGGLLLSLLVTALMLLAPLAAPRRFLDGVTRGAALRAALMVAFVASGLALLGFPLFMRLDPILGRADLVPLVLPFTLCIALGIGFGLGGRSYDVLARSALQRSALVLLFVLAPLVMGLDPLLGASLGLGVVARMGVAGALVGIVGVLLGALLALAVRIASSLGERPLTSSVAVAGASAALSLHVAAWLALRLGLSAALLAGGASVLLAAAVAPAARRKIVLEEPRPEPPSEPEPEPEPAPAPPPAHDAGPEIELSVDGPEIELSVDGPEIELSVDGPEIELSVDGPEIELSVEDEPLHLD